MKEYILSLDQGTTSSRAVLFNAKGEKVASVQKEYPQIFPGNGWVEHDPMDILESQLSSAREVIAKAGITAEDVAAIGIANQRETTILWDKNTGKPVYNAIVWQCRRTSEDCARMESQGLQKFFKDKTGLLIDPYFSATKIKWILENVEGVRERAEKGEILFGTVDCWLIWNLTGEGYTLRTTPMLPGLCFSTFTPLNGTGRYWDFWAYPAVCSLRSKNVRVTWAKLRRTFSEAG